MTEDEKTRLRARITSSHHRRHKTKDRSRFSFWLLLGIVFLTAAVFLFPQFHFEKFIDVNGIWWVDVAQHIIFFFFFCLILFRLLPFQKLNLSFFLFIFLFSAFFEFLQFLLFEISISYRDITSNFIGISLAFIVYLLVANKKLKPKKRRIQDYKK